MHFEFGGLPRPPSPPRASSARVSEGCVRTRRTLASAVVRLETVELAWVDASGDLDVFAPAAAGLVNDLLLRSVSGYGHSQRTRKADGSWPWPETGLVQYDSSPEPFEVSESPIEVCLF